MRTETKQNAPGRFIYVLMAGTAAGITVTGILTQIPWIKILPLYISVVIFMLQSKVSRTAYLLGAFNSLLYAYVDFSYGLYGTVAYDILFSSAIQLFTYFHWKKRSQGQTVRLKKMSAGQYVLWSAVFLAVFFGFSAVLSYFGSAYRFFDTLLPLLGIAVSVLTAFAYVEYGALQLIHLSLNVALNITMLGEHPERVPYLIYSLYAFICVVFALRRLMTLWKTQTAGKTNPAEKNTKE